MESLVLTRDGLQIADTPKPPLMPGYVQIEVRSVGISERDISIWNGDYEVELPVILGYEFTGVIHESSVQDIQPGTMVTSEIDVGCQRCWYCRSGQQYFCNSKKTLGKSRDGALAEYIAVPADIIHTLPVEVNSIIGTFLHPLASALKIVTDVPPKANEPVLIMGSGEMGVLTAQVYDAFGADVYLAGDNRWKLGVARQLGMTNTLNWSNKDWKQTLLERTEGIGPRIVIDTKSEMESITSAVDLIQSNGILVLSNIPSKDGLVSSSKIVDKGIKVIGNNQGRYRDATDMLAKRRIEVERLVNKEFKLEEGDKAFEHASDPSVTKVIINI